MNVTDYVRGALVIAIGLLALCSAEEARKRQFGADDANLGFGNGLFGKTGDGKLQDWQSFFAKRIGIKRGLGSSQYGFGSPWSDSKLQDWKNYFARSARFNGGLSSGGGFGSADIGQGTGKFQSWNGGLFKRDAEEAQKH
jgi:hypothetical protein